MVLLGIVLILLAAGAGVALFAGTAQLEDTVDVGLLGGTLSLPPLALLITGMVVISLFWLGWAILRGGLRHNKKRRVQAKEDAAAAKVDAAAAEERRIAEEKRLQAELSTRDEQLAEERRLRETETAALRQQSTPAPAPDQTRTPQP